MKAWKPDNDPLLQRRMGKTIEELGELTAVCARVAIQGINSVDPSSGLTNAERLLHETADVLAQLECNMEELGLNRVVIMERRRWKIEQMAHWERLLRGKNDSLFALHQRARP